ncbi:MAG: VanZ family protein [Pirellulales bacterium]|nr:VanZ family protein [Pirellulales bacterium]
MRFTTARLLMTVSGIILGLYVLTQFVLTHIALPASLGSSWNLPLDEDKVLHFLAYGGLGLIAGAWWSWGRMPTLAQFLALGGILIAYAALDEITQIPVGRHADVVDWLFDVAGIISGLLVVWLIWRTGPDWLSSTTPPGIPLPRMSTNWKRLRYNWREKFTKNLAKEVDTTANPTPENIESSAATPRAK